ncbi:hypothetical protein D3C71_2141980 [compost metagenome]
MKEIEDLDAEVRHVKRHWPEAADELAYKAAARGFQVGILFTVIIAFLIWVFIH